MALRVITEADIDVLLPAVQVARSGVTRDDALALFRSPNPAVLIGDPAIPAMLRLERYRLPQNHPILAGLMAVHLTDFYPLRTQSFTRNTMVPMLAEIVGRAVEQYPALGPLPFWTYGSTAMASRAPEFFPRIRPQAAGNGFWYLWYDKLSDAAADLAPRRP